MIETGIIVLSLLGVAYALVRVIRDLMEDVL